MAAQPTVQQEAEHSDKDTAKLIEEDKVHSINKLEGKQDISPSKPMSGEEDKVAKGEEGCRGKLKTFVSNYVCECLTVITVAVVAITVILSITFVLSAMAMNRGTHTLYKRWGSSTCPDVSGTSLVYSGVMGGHHHSVNGGGTNFQCMPTTDIEYTLPYSPGIQNHSTIYGTEYRTYWPADFDDVPCAVCLVSTRSVTMMIPARTSCPDGWTREYYGYLMSQKQSESSSTFECVDHGMEVYPGTHTKDEIALLYNVEASCSGIPCAPYNNEQELNCVVCTL